MTELKNMPVDELRRELRTRRAEYAKVKMSVELGSEKNHASLRSMRRDIARMMMILEEMGKTNKKAEKAKRIESSSLPSLPSKPSSSSRKKLVASPGS